MRLKQIFVSTTKFGGQYPPWLRAWRSDVISVLCSKETTFDWRKNGFG